MRAILIEKNGTRHEMEIEGAGDAGVVLWNDTRMNPPLRVFRYASSFRISTVTFVEVDFVHIDAVSKEHSSVSKLVRPYERHGFVLTGETRNPAGDPWMERAAR